MFGNRREQAIQRYKDFMNEIGSEECLEIKQLKRLSDKEGLETIKQYLCIQSVEELKKMDKEKRDAALRKSKAAKGVSMLCVYLGLV